MNMTEEKSLDPLLEDGKGEGGGADLLPAQTIARTDVERLQCGAAVAVELGALEPALGNEVVGRGEVLGRVVHGVLEDRDSGLFDLCRNRTGLLVNVSSGTRRISNETKRRG